MTKGQAFYIAFYPTFANRLCIDFFRYYGYHIA